ncbi:MAG: hypothetical protein AAF543_06025 [Pseudomonadota bacterium]
MAPAIAGGIAPKITSKARLIVEELQWLSSVLDGLEIVVDSPDEMFAYVFWKLGLES